MSDNAKNDESYKLLFSQPAMMQALLHCIAGDDLLASLDLNDMQLLATEHISDKLDKRHNDLVWQIRRTDGSDMLLLVMLEHQSSNDLEMAVRMLTYHCLLYGTLLRSKQISVRGGLPVMLPIVLYSGTQPWTACTDIAELIQPAPASLRPYQPSYRYLLIDEAKAAADPGAPPNNLATLTFQLEHNKGPDDMQQTLQRIYDNTSTQRELRRAFVSWIRYVLLPRALPDVKLPEINDFMEVRDMLAQNSRSWTEQWKQEGELKGLHKGLHQGMARTLSTLLKTKFGAVPPWASERLQQADEDHLTHWSVRVLTANTLDQVFDDE